MLNHTPLRISFKKEFSADCQPRYPVKIPITTWKSLSPPRGLQLYPSCQARCPAKTSNAMEIYPAPSTAQLLTMLLHREHFCSYLYYTQFGEKINQNEQILPIMHPAFFISVFLLPLFCRITARHQGKSIQVHRNVQHLPHGFHSPLVRGNAHPYCTKSQRICL